MTSSRLVPGRVGPHLATVSIALGLLVACGGSVETDPEGEGGTAATTGGAQPRPSTGPGSTGEGGGSTTTSGSSGGGGDVMTGAGAGGAAPACEGAIAGAECDVEGTSCEELTGQGVCDEGMPRITSCVGGRWEVWTAISCGPFTSDPSCAVPGRYRVEASGPFAPEESAWLADEHGGPFEVTLEVRDDGRLWASAERGWIEAGTCDVRAGWTLDESCEDEDGESFCTTIDRTLELTMATDPAVGTVELECWGECSGTATAPVTATRL